MTDEEQPARSAEETLEAINVNTVAMESSIEEMLKLAIDSAKENMSLAREAIKEQVETERQTREKEVAEERRTRRWQVGGMAVILLAAIALGFISFSNTRQIAAEAQARSEAICGSAVIWANILVGSEPSERDLMLAERLFWQLDDLLGETGGCANPFTREIEWIPIPTEDESEPDDSEPSAFTGGLTFDRNPVRETEEPRPSPEPSPSPDDDPEYPEYPEGVA